jgi:hypothetical protein
LYVFSSTKRKGGIGFSQKQGVWEGGKVAQIMYTHVNKCKNNKIKWRKEEEM